MLPWTARGQALAEWYYWFDYDSSPRESGKIIGQQFQLQPDVSHLHTGVHTLYVQVVDTAGVYSTPVGTMFFKVPDATTIDKLFYTIDTEGTPTVLDFGNGSFTLDVSKYQAGFHRITLQVMDKQNGVSDVMPYMFYKVPQNSHLAEFRYWFDSDATVRTMPYGQGHYILDVAHLIPGFHFINYYVADGEENMTKIDNAGFFRLPVASNQKLHYWFAGDTIATQVPDFQDGFIVDVTRLQEGFNTIYFQLEDNGPTDIMTEHFIKIPQTENGGDMTLVCIIDGKVVGEEKVSAHGGAVRCNMDVSRMDVGLHKAMFQLITPSGSGSSIAETYFIRTLTNAEVATMQCSYTIDGFRHRVHKGTCTNGVFHFDLPVEDVEDGLHRIDYLLVAENGASTTQGSAWFFKTPVGGNGITQYDYWLNDKSDEVQSVVLDEPKDPFQLIKLLPIPSEPIRSSCFHFEVKDEKPMMYAKNDIHFRFHDRTGRWVDESKLYVDYNVSAEVADIAELQSTQTFARPEENGVKWFKFEAEYGDSIALKSNLTSGIEVFSTSGKLLYSASGSSSVSFGGCHILEDGTHYVAVHDVTGSSSELTLYSQRIDKYSIFEYTPDVISDEGTATFTFTGNGLEYVKLIELTDGSTTISADSLFSNGRQMISSFNLDANRLVPSVYTLRVLFNNEDRNDNKVLTLKDAVTIEPAQAGDIDVSVVRENRVGDPYPVQVHIKNNGNVAYWGIPLGIAFDGINRFDALTFENFKYYISEEEYIKKNFFAYSDNLLGTGKDGLYFPMILPYIGPYEEITYVIGVKTKIAHANINIYTWVGEPWSESAKESASSSNVRMARREAPCQPTNLPQLHDLLGAIGNLGRPLQLPAALGQLSIGTGEAIGGIIQGATRAREDAIFDAYGIPPEDRDDYRFHYRYCPRSPMDIAASFAPNGNPLHIQKKAPMKARTLAENASSNCPHVSPVPVNPWIPGDPNEINGYLSESGSHYINTEVVNVGYDIEFENDPEIANAPAHHIVIRDTLDARFFDFDSFVPKTVKISGKEVELDGNYPFVKSLDMRPEINSIAELRGNFDKKTGIATWDLIALDPMAMEPTDDIMQGILPVNTQDGNGIGNVTFTINLKQNLGDGSEIPNRADIIFDYNDPILTPTWTNIIDAVPPTSHVSGLEQVNDTIMRLTFDGEDNRSGVWKYTLYVQDGLLAPWREVATDIAPDSVYTFQGFDCIDYGFCVLATDSAGNVEKKQLTAEAIRMADHKGDANSDGYVTVADLALTASYILGAEPEGLAFKAADVNADGTISVADLASMAYYILQGSWPTEAQVKAFMRGHSMWQDEEE